MALFAHLDAFNNMACLYVRPVALFASALFNPFLGKPWISVMYFRVSESKYDSYETGKDSAGDGFQHNKYYTGHWPASAIHCFEEMVACCWDNCLYLLEWWQPVVAWRFSYKFGRSAAKNSFHRDAMCGLISWRKKIYQAEKIHVRLQKLEICFVVHESFVAS